jgi:hypothetical protein
MTTRQPKCRTRHGAIRAAEVPVPAPNVIEAAERFRARRPTAAVGSASIIRPDFKAGYRTAEKLRRPRQPSLERLPFVTMKGGNPAAGATSYWNDIPTGNGRDDFKRGKKYAALAIEAMTADGCAWYLEKIIEAMVVDAVSRRAKGGKHSRTLPPAVDGFIHELSRRFCTKTSGIAPAS